MDANSTFTFGLLFMVVGGFSTIYGIVAKRDSKKLQEGKAQGIPEATLKQMNETLDAFKKSNDIFQKEHREEHRELNTRLNKVEEFVVRHDEKSKRRKSDVEE